MTCRGAFESWVTTVYIYMNSDVYMYNTYLCMPRELDYYFNCRGTIISGHPKTSPTN